MNESKIAEFRSQANMCTAKAEAATDEISKLFYIKLGNEWLELANKLERGHFTDWRKSAKIGRQRRQPGKPVTFPIEGQVLERQRPRVFRFQDQAE